MDRPGPAALDAVKGCILAAGYGRRLAPITDHIPKPLLPVGHVPLVGYALRLLAHHGITGVTVNLHHLGRLVREALADGAAYGVRLAYSVENEILGTGGGLKNMLEHLDTTFVVLNSDTIIDVDLAAVVAAHRRSGALATMVLRRSPEPGPGAIGIDREGRIGRILGQSAAGAAPASPLGYNFAGVHVMEPRFLEYLPPGVPTCLVRYGYLKALHNREPLTGVVVDGYWQDAGTPASYYQANVDALADAMPLAHVDPLAGYALSPRHSVATAVRMGNDVELGDQTRLGPPLVVGDGCRLGHRAQVGPLAVLGKKVLVGKEATVSHSVLLDGAKVEPGAVVVRRLVGRRAVLALD